MEVTVISIVSLIYKSTVYADSVFSSLYRHTPMLHNDQAEFFFIANDASPEVINHLQTKGYKYVIHDNVHRSEEELFKEGIGPPEYISRVYKGWNRAVKEAKGKWVCLVNSDNLFSPNWLENLIKHSNDKNIVCSQLIESGRFHSIFRGAHRVDFGTHPSNFNEEAFLTFCNTVHSSLHPELRIGGAYMPCLVLKENVVRAGFYPPGNVAGKVPTVRATAEFGDQCLFRRLREIGVKHYTVLDSLVYHFKEGEMDE